MQQKRVRLSEQKTDCKEKCMPYADVFTLYLVFSRFSPAGTTDNVPFGEIQDIGLSTQ